MIGTKIRQLREAKGLVQRQLASELEVDTAYVCKMENGEKPVSRLHLKKLSRLFGISEQELLNIWLADKVMSVLKNEKKANLVKALEIASRNV